MSTQHKVGYLSNAVFDDGIVWQDAERMSGAPCFTGTRVPVKTLFDYLAAGDSLESFLDHFPGVRREQATALLTRIGRELDERRYD